MPLASRPRSPARASRTVNHRPPSSRRLFAAEALESRRLLAADLDVTSITGVEASYSVQDRIKATVNIANVGTFLSNTGPFYLRFYLSREGTGGSSQYALIEEAHVLNVLAGVPTSDVINGLGYFIPAATPQGNYHITVYLDWYNAVDGRNDPNNVGISSTFRIERPDLYVPEVLDTADSYSVTERIGATALISNRGLGYADGFGLRYYLGPDNGTDNRRYPIEDGSVLFFLRGGQS